MPDVSGSPRRRGINHLDGRGVAFLAAALLTAGSLTGCGSQPHEFPPAAEPARSPAPIRPPAGRVVPLAGHPEGLVADPRTGLVATGLRNPDRLALVDGATGRVVKRVPLPESPRHLQLAAPGGPVLVPAERADRLAIVSLPSGRLRVVEVGRHPHDAATVAGRVFVGDEQGDALSLVDRGREARRVKAPLQPGGVADVAGSVGVVAVRERVLALFDPRTLRKTAQAGAGVGPTHVVSDGTGRAFVVDTQGNSLLVFHARPKLEIVRRIALAGTPYGVAVDRPRHRLWVTLTATNELAELSDHRVIRRFPTIRMPDTVTVNERTGRVYVASPVSDQLQIIDP